MEQYNATKNSESHFEAKKDLIQSQADVVGAGRHVVIQSEADVVSAGKHETRGKHGKKRFSCDWLQPTARENLCCDWLKHAVRLHEALGKLETWREKDQNVEDTSQVTTHVKEFTDKAFAAYLKTQVN